MDDKFVQLLQSDYPSFRFCQNSRFSFRPPKTIKYNPFEENAELLLLHELGHAINQDSDYSQDITRIKIESNAWKTASEIYQKYQKSHPDLITFFWDQDFIESQLDTYRDWLHSRSKCPRCHLTRYQTPDKKYHCPHCDTFMTI